MYCRSKPNVMGKNRYGDSSVAALRKMRRVSAFSAAKELLLLHAPPPSRDQPLEVGEEQSGLFTLKKKKQQKNLTGDALFGCDSLDRVYTCDVT